MIQLNGIGGKLEFRESGFGAMVREFKEETGIKCSGWRFVTFIGGEDWEVSVWTCKSDDVFNFKTMESEQVNLIPICDLDQYPIISNLRWLIPMCMDKIGYSITRP